MTTTSSVSVSPRAEVILEDLDQIITEAARPPTRVRLSASVPSTIVRRADLAPDIPRAVETLRLPFTVR